MDTGGVENPGAVNSRDDKASAASEKELMDAPIEDNGVNFDAVSESAETTNEEKDYNFSSKDISKREKTNYFVNVAGAEKLAKKAEKDKLKQEQRSRKEMLKEASKSKADEAKERNAKEAAKNREAKHIREKYRFEKFRGFLWRHKLIIISAITVITLAVLAIIFVPIIIENINAAQKEQIIRENKTDMMKIFEQVAGKEFEWTELEKIVKEIDSEIEINFYESVGDIRSNKTSDAINFYVIDKNNTVMAYNFEFSGVVDGIGVQILVDNGEYGYFELYEKKDHGSAEEMIEHLLYRRNGIESD